MQTVDIIEAFISQIENLIIKQWKHSGFIEHYESDTVVFDIDGINYKVTIEQL